MAEVRLGKSPSPQKTVTVTPLVDSADMQKAPMGKRLFHAFFMVDSPKQVLDNLLFRVMIPSIKELVENMFNKGLHMMLNGEVPSIPSGTQTNGQNYVSYGNFWGGSQGSPNAQQILQVRSSTDFDMPIIRWKKGTDIPDEDTAKQKAEQILKEMRDIANIQGYVSVSNLYQAVNRTPEWTDEYYGWRDLKQASIVPVVGGYVISMPKAGLLR